MSKKVVKTDGFGTDLKSVPMRLTKPSWNEGPDRFGIAGVFN
jgi:hypothetical protein